MATASDMRTEPMDEADETALLDSIQRWLDREVRPVIIEHDHEDKWPEKLVPQMAEMGLFGATVGKQYGGLGLPATTYAKIVMLICSYWMSISGIFNTHLILCTAIEKFGTERRDGDYYVINGSKTWITNGIHGSVFALLVKTDPDAEPRYKGMSLFIAPKGEGFVTGKRLGKLGYKSIESAELHFDDYRVPADNLIGGEEGQGFFQATGGLELGRINVAARGAGMAEGALKLASDYAQQRETMGKPICEHQAIQLMLGEMVTRARAARLLTLDAAEAYDGGARCDMEAGMAKYFASEAARKNAEDSMRIHGGIGYSTEHHVERFYRDAMLTVIGEGTNEIQRIVISKQWVKRNPV
ncbi:MAG: acyl-CoA dehydrogenase family protein [Sphingomonadales bacterium]|nr:acyl-CoA dehydrogenase family protein [Sphingomonadales bacterium]